MAITEGAVVENSGALTKGGTVNQPDLAQLRSKPGRVLPASTFTGFLSSAGCGSFSVSFVLAGTLTPALALGSSSFSYKLCF